MSLDVYLRGQPYEATCDHCGSKHMKADTLFDANITHNLNTMAEEAGFYNELWRPDEHDIKTAKQLGDAIAFGLHNMREDPDRFKKLSATNGWGTYEQFIPWLERLLAACREYPGASVEASR